MFSYRHGFHVGNHADVLKHLVMVHLLDYLGQKDTPYWVIDTHAGAGKYDLQDAWGREHPEHDTGISRIWGRKDAPPAVARYLQAVAAHNPDGKLRYYPGSPWLALDAQRPGDSLRLFEWHPSEVAALDARLHALPSAQQRRVRLLHDNGFTGLKALLPPPPRRGLVMIDPSYEDKTDYAQVVRCVADGLTRFATGCYAVWYPLVQRNAAHRLPVQLRNLPAKAWLHVSLQVQRPATDGFGLHGSGMLILNPPWTLAATLRETMPWLTEALAQDDSATFTLDGRQP